MANLDTITKLKDKVDRLKAKAERAKGAAEVIRKTLKDEWECGSLKEAKALLASKRKHADKLQADFDTRFEAFQEEWADELDALD